MPDTAAHGERARRPSAWQTMREDYRRHGSSVTNGAFISLCVYRFGRWGLQRRSALGRKLASKVYGFMNLFVANITKIWIPPQVTIGDAFHIVNNEGSLSIHPEAVIGDRLGVMHNVTIGTNMKRGVPTIGDDVFIGTNSTVLGNIRIGDRVRIGANTAVSTDVPSDSVCVGSPARIYPRLGPLL
ncbi:serine O-acetyltransferase [Novosphingobium resinovorum]|uniref:serine O-acetyltransferase n=1 Tax=Novosphingobium resinovorum TaxID=158500 RepID=UPI0009F6EE81|nr:serine acetyltransferase [Novosphingobium resinovorum]